MRIQRSIPLLLALAWWLVSMGRLLADGTNAPDAFSQEGSDFNPGLGLMALFMILVFMISVGVGLAFGLVAFALAGLLVAVGILTTSAIVGFIRRSPASAFRVLFLQLGGMAGVPVGIGAAWIVAWLTQSDWSVASRLLVGALLGMSGGVLLGWLFNLACGRIGSWFLARFDHRPPDDPKGGVVDV